MTSPFSVSMADDLNYFSFASSARRKVSLTFGLLRPPSGRSERQSVCLISRADETKLSRLTSSANEIQKNHLI